MKLLSAQTGNRVLIKQAPIEQVSDKFIIPATAGKKPLKGKVVAVSEYYTCTENGEKIFPIVKVGDEVIYQPCTDYEVELEGEDLVILMEYNIVAVL